jgi:mitogen-activated protein kinase kinase 1
VRVTGRMKPMLSFPDSDDEDDDIGGLPPTPSIAHPGSEADQMAQSFMLSQSGSFHTNDFKVNKGGLTVGKNPSPDFAAGAASRSAGSSVQSLADLETLNELGAGASGTVFRTRHRLTGEILAVKQVTILDKPKRDQVVTELKMLMSHNGCPWIVSLYQAFYEEAKVYTVLEFMDGGSVADLVEKHKDAGLRDERELGKIGLQVLNGLNYLHKEMHQVHRDLKPANIMLKANGAVKIADFGISSQLDSTGAHCSTFVGTTCYMSPERLSGEHYNYTADIWAFGIILLELAQGKYPYPEADSYFKLLEQIMDGPAPNVPEEEDFSPALAEFLRVCLDKLPTLRPAAQELIRHPFLRQYPLDDEMLLSIFDGMNISMGS